MKKTALAAGIALASLVGANNAAADEPFELQCNSIDSLHIEQNSDVCDLDASFTTPNGQDGSLSMVANGNLLCTALEVKWANGVTDFDCDITVDFDNFSIVLTDIYQPSRPPEP